MISAATIISADRSVYDQRAMIDPILDRKWLVYNQTIHLFEAPKKTRATLYRTLQAPHTPLHSSEQLTN